MKRYFHFKGKKVFYSDEGTGDPVIMIHGYLETGDVWSGFVKRLTGKYRVLCIDLPGHGESDMYDRVHTMEFMAGVVEGMMNSTGIERAFITGHSMGGYITLAFLDLFRQRINGYCLFHSHPFPDTRQTIEKRVNEINMAGSGKKFLFYPGNIKNMYADDNHSKFNAQIERSLKIASEIRPEGISSVLYGMMERPSRLHLMESGLVPLLWILGVHDNYIPCEEMRNRVTLTPDSELVVLENSGHVGFIEEEELSANLLIDFMTRRIKN